MNVSLNILTNCLSCMWSLSSYHYGDKETVDNIIIVQSSMIIFSGDVQG